MHGCLTSSKCVSKCVLRVGFGAALFLFGVAHYMDFQAFAPMVTGGFTGVLASLAGLWAYILPLLMIVGGGLFVAGYRMDIAAWCGGVALLSIIIGMMLKDILGTVTMGEVAPAVQNALLWLLVYLFAVKSHCCGCGSGCGTGAEMQEQSHGGGCC